MPFSPIDYHMHSRNSCDTNIPMHEMCERALELDIPEIAFTEHYNEHQGDICKDKYSPENYFRDLEECRTRYAPHGLTIRAGLEVGEGHLYQSEVETMLSAYPYDFVLGSLHWTRGESIFNPQYFSARSAHDAMTQYFIELAEMAEVSDYDCLSHIDVCKRFAYNVYNHFSITDWENVVRPVLAAVIKRGKGIEINTSALRMPVAQVHPGAECIQWYREMGGEVLTIGSDSHNPRQLGTGLDVALDVARAAGFTQLARYERRKIIEWIPI